jgi:hypothetical protein
MTCRIQNVTRRLVSVRGNSGETWHLPPAVSIDLMDAEVMDNPMMAKLVAKGVITVQAVQQEERVEPAPNPPERG